MRLGPVLALLALSAPVGAMTSEDCARIRDKAAAIVPAAGELTLAGAVTEDGWCRVIDGPLAGLEWQFGRAGDGLQADVRRERVAFDDLGPFDLTATVRMSPEGALSLGPAILLRRDGDFLSVKARTRGQGPTADDLGPLVLAGAELRVSGDDGLVGEVLAWAFRLDVGAARSNFTLARDQRADMTAWLEDLPAAFGDAGSRAAFRELVEAYPNARGTAVLSVPEDSEVSLGGLARALLLGSPFSRDEGAALVEAAGPVLNWTSGE